MYQYKREPLTEDEANRLALACQNHDERMIIWTLLNTGLRISELVSLKKENIDWQNHRLIIFGKGGRFGSKTKRRIVPMSNRIQGLLEGHFSIYDTLCLKTRTIQRMVHEIATRAGISKSITPHVLRHTFAVTALKKGINLPSLMRILGHNNLNTTQIYLNLSGEDVIKEFRDKW